MRLRLITLMLLALAAVVGGCDNGQATHKSNDTSTKSTPRPDVLLEPYTIAPQGREFVEGAVSGYSLDPKGRALATTSYDSPTKLQVKAGPHVMLVQVWPCEASCQGWDSVLDMIHQQQAANDGTSAIEDQLITCRGTFNAKNGDRFDLTPIINSATCTIDGTIAAEPENCEPVEFATVSGAASHHDLADHSFDFVEVDGCAVPDDVVRTIAFTTKQWSGQLDCNSSNGTFILKQGGLLSLEPGVSTLAACSQEDYDINAAELQQVDVTEDGELVFDDEAGNRVAVAKPAPS